MADPSPADATLIALYDLRRDASNVRTAEEIRAYAMEALDHELEPPLDQLHADGLIAPEGDAWRLTDAGLVPARERHRAMQSAGFDATLLATASSAAYRRYCEAVYGSALHQYNMIDGPQLDAALAYAGLTAGQRFVDLGCALGHLTEHVADVTGAHGLGLDFAPGAIASARDRTADRPDLTFRVGDLNDLQLQPDSADVVLLLDTVYFVSDVPELVRRIAAALRPRGRLVAFDQVVQAQGADHPALQPGNSRLAMALDASGIPWTHTDFTARAHAMWRRARAAVDALKPDFEAEGSAEMWTSRDREVAHILPSYDEGRKARYLLRAEP